jgi:hypothetical protein
MDSKEIAPESDLDGSIRHMAKIYMPKGSFQAPITPYLYNAAKLLGLNQIVMLYLQLSQNKEYFIQLYSLINPGMKFQDQPFDNPSFVCQGIRGHSSCCLTTQDTNYRVFDQRGQSGY